VSNSFKRIPNFIEKRESKLTSLLMKWIEDNLEMIVMKLEQPASKNKD
jgi:hypothetical protein